MVAIADYGYMKMNVTGDSSRCRVALAATVIAE
jgi:hypothetical protein